MKIMEMVNIMKSVDYKDRFRLEYQQLHERTERLSAMLKKYKAGTLDFEPVCPYEILKGQLTAMKLYLAYLEARAKIEGIRL